MNDPHVNALRYRFVVGKDVDYNNAAPLSVTTEDFDLFLDGKNAVFKMKGHYSTANEAKAVVERYLRAWDILIGLEQDPEDFRLEFDHADIIDRSPDTNDRNVLNLQAHVSAHVVLSAALASGVKPAVEMKSPTSPSF